MLNLAEKRLKYTSLFNENSANKLDKCDLKLTSMAAATFRLEQQYFLQHDFLDED